MPRNLTWWQAAKFARAGTPVRREGWADPVVWITHPVPGLFFRHEEINTLLPDPHTAVPTPHIVRAAEFTGTEFRAADWTTLPPGGVDPKPPEDPTGDDGGDSPNDPGPNDPDGDDGGDGGGGRDPNFPGGNGDYPPGPTGGPIIVPPDFPPGPDGPIHRPKPPKPVSPTPKPAFSGMSAVLGPEFVVTCDLTPVVVGSWSVTAKVHGDVYSMGVALPGHTHFTMATTFTHAVAGDTVTFEGKSLSGPADIRDFLAIGTCVVVAV